MKNKIKEIEEKISWWRNHAKKNPQFIKGCLTRIEALKAERVKEANKIGKK